jgi:hypothetical protein
MAGPRPAGTGRSADPQLALSKHLLPSRVPAHLHARGADNFQHHPAALTLSVRLPEIPEELLISAAILKAIDEAAHPGCADRLVHRRRDDCPFSFTRMFC